MATITLKHINKSFDSIHLVINEFNLEINDGEFIVLVGPSGCGKSTLLRMIAGLEIPTTGEIWISDTLVNPVPPKDRNIAMVFQNYALYPHMNVFDNLAFGLKLRKVPKSEIVKRVHKAADILEIKDLLDRKPKQLSGGQSQRVALGRAIVRDPKVFLFDEPLSNLDAKLRVHMRAEIKKLHRQLGATMIYVTHDQVEAMTIGDRIVILNDGVIQQVGTPLDVYQNPANRFVASFIGSPPMNFLEGKIENSSLLAEKVSINLSEANNIQKLEGENVIFGIRPEDIHLTEDGLEFPVVINEPLGNENFLHLQAGQQILIARIPALESIQLGDRVRVSFDLSKACFFDSKSEDRLFYT